MKYKWLNNKNNSKLIIFFNGWGMDECVVKHLDCQDYDVLMFYNYNTLDTDFHFDLLNIYSEKNLVAWSMGVMIGTKFANLIELNQSVAINGTLKPIDESFGIHPKIYDLTLKGFNEKGRNRFINSMFNSKSDLLHESLEREIEEQRTELYALKNYQANDEFRYEKIIISSDDKIIPTKSQVAYWGIEPILKTGHCPFFEYKKWSELL